MIRLFLAIVAALLGLGLALLLGAGAAVALIALAAGAAAAAFAMLRPSEALPAAEASPPAEQSPTVLPPTADLLAAFDDPLLLIQGRRVVMANPPARALLGDHIEGEDVRVAIRHPGATERLIAADEHAVPATVTELVGLGDPDRRWEMATSRLPDGSRLVRLSDRSRAYAAEQMRVDFVANASHELRTPLATLLGFLETLQDEGAAGDSKTRGRFLKIMFDEASRMRALVEDLLSLSRVEAERFTVPRTPVDLLPLIEDAKTGLARLIEERHSPIEVEKHSDSTVVAGDRAQLLQLISNLISNALKYGRCGVPVRVRIDDAGSGMVRVAVIDQGEGIAPEHLPRLTQRFYRVDAGRSRAAGGTGLGLAIAKHIVERHRGRLEILSKVGKGTSARVYLPRANSA